MQPSASRMNQEFISSRSSKSTGGTGKRVHFEEEKEEESDLETRNKRAKTTSAISAIIKEYTDPVTGKLFVDPVMTEEGKLQEREAYKKMNPTDDLESSSLSPDSVMGNITSTNLPATKLRAYPAPHVRNTIKHLVRSGDVDPAKAKEWEEAAQVSNMMKRAECGDRKAMCYLGKWHGSGSLGLPKNQTISYTWYKKAADLGDISGQENAGRCLVHGLGVTSDPAQGIELLTRAAQKGSGISAYNLGSWNFSGRYGLEKDMAKAKYWLTKVTRTKNYVCGNVPEKHIFEAQIMLDMIENNKNMGFSPLIYS